ncbi:MAG TPA: hypothetical protein VKB41_09105 [Steroidobacteraceae bacterium]|nr:hypothetical protein [Steroidobacteraceae bacterium]
MDSRSRVLRKEPLLRRLLRALAGSPALPMPQARAVIGHANYYRMSYTVRSLKT